jgi:hypothetical protein
MTFHRINEDPFYDDDGNLVDEDADWEDVKEETQEVEVSYSPYDTLNS